MVYEITFNLINTYHKGHTKNIYIAVDTYLNDRVCACVCVCVYVCMCVYVYLLLNVYQHKTGNNFFFFKYMDTPDLYDIHWLSFFK